MPEEPKEASKNQYEFIAFYFIFVLFNLKAERKNTTRWLASKTTRLCYMHDPEMGGGNSTNEVA